MIHPDLFAVLACPETRQSLALADDALLAKVNAAIEAGSCKNIGGTAIERAFDAGLVREDAQVVYPVRDDIPVLLVDEGVRVDSL